MGEVIIHVSHVGRTFSGKVPTVAVKDVSFDVGAGEFLAIMGKSGSGKSTLLHSLGLLDTPSKGEIIIDGVDVAKLTEREKTIFRLNKLGYIFQEYAILPELTALENVYLPLMVNDNKDDALERKEAIAMLERVGLGHRLDHYPSELSGGEQQRVAIARGLANKPQILFADEPCANLDSRSSEDVLKLLAELNKTLKQTIIMVTHEPDDKKWVDRVIWLKDGEIEQIEKDHKRVTH
ncbi:MAG: ABC transporter ATP-binding protein [Patescibacteria group bacterium]